MRNKNRQSLNSINIIFKIALEALLTIPALAVKIGTTNFFTIILNSFSWDQFETEFSEVEQAKQSKAK